jgi:hypothetical protein
MIDLRRLRGPLVALAFVAAPLVLINRALVLAWPGDRVASYQSTLTPGELDSVGRMLSMDLARTGGQLRPPDARFGVVIGASTGQTATEVADLQRAYEQPSAWYGYFATGANVSDLARIAPLVWKYAGAPDYLVICLNPMMLADSDRDVDPVYLPNVAIFNRQARESLLRAKMGLLDRFGQDSAEVVFAPEVHPTRPGGDEPRGPTAPREIIEGDMRSFGLLGCFDPARYPIGGVNYRALVDLIEGEHRHGTKVVAVLLPESTTFRAKFPPEARRALLSALEAPAGDARPLILDFSRFLDDSLFWDYHHVSWMNEGRKLFSEELGRRVRAAESNPPTTIQEIPPAPWPRRTGS